MYKCDKCGEEYYLLDGKEVGHAIDCERYVDIYKPKKK
jgi:hypothetical protein